MATKRTIATAYTRLRHNFGSKQLVPHEQESECVRDLEYDLEHQEMIIHFQKRGSYRYYNVEPWVFAEFNNAGASRGIYFNLYVRPSYTNYERIV